MKLWQKNASTTQQEIEKFTIANDQQLDEILARYDILASFAHILMLFKIKIINKQELGLLKKELAFLYELALINKLKIDPNVEDIHSQIEFLLTKKLGDLGKKIHTARSRNDQILVDLKLFARQEILDVAAKTKNVFDTLIKQSERYKNFLLPGYTHFQVAMPSSFGLWFGAYAESLTDDMHTLVAALKICNQNPLGSAAGFGSSFAIDRKYTTELLGFETLNYNVVYAQMTRGKFEKICLQALSNIASTLNKLSSDVCLYVNENYKFLFLPDSFTTGSSIMPHKKNPDAFELVRACSNKIHSLCFELTSLSTNLPSGYHRDMQLTKSALIEGFDTIKKCLNVTNILIQNISVNETILQNKIYDHIFSVEEVNKLVIKGMPFRDAYKKIGGDIETNNYKPNKEILHTHLGSMGNLCHKEIILKMKLILNNISAKKIIQTQNKLIQQLYSKR